MPIPEPMWSFRKLEKTIGSVVIDILNYKQTKNSLIYIIEYVWRGFCWCKIMKVPVEADQQNLIVVE